MTTPRPGIIQKRYYQEGYYAKVGTALFQIADISTLLAKIDVPEGYVQSIAVGNPVEIHIPSMSGDNKTVRASSQGSARWRRCLPARLKRKFP